MMTIGTMNFIDDISADGTATLWWWRDGGKLNVELICSDIASMLQTKELLDMYHGGAVDLPESRVWEFCVEAAV